ncbi:unnamed protein product, partial [Amoebophrya sp. A120]
RRRRSCREDECTTCRLSCRFWFGTSSTRRGRIGTYFSTAARGRSFSSLAASHNSPADHGKHAPARKPAMARQRKEGRAMGMKMMPTAPATLAEESRRGRPGEVLAPEIKAADATRKLIAGRRPLCYWRRKQRPRPCHRFPAPLSRAADCARAH